MKNSELQTCLKLYYQKCKGVGAWKLYNTISKVFCGITEREVQTYINRLQMHQQLHPTFINKQPLNPVKSSSVMAQVQMDLVDMQNISVQNDANPFRYVLVILDVFSRYIVLRPLQSKSSCEVSTHVLQLFSDVGPPKRVQTDQGTEFKGVLTQLMDKFKIDIIHSRPYHPQSQGKVLVVNIGREGSVKI